MTTNSALLKLVALDAQDLEIVSAHLQDAVVRVEDLAYRPKQQRLVAFCNRFDWEHAHDGRTVGKRSFERRRSALRIERVRSAKLQNIRLDDKDAVLALLAVQFEAGEAPAGILTLTFAGNAAIRLEVECVEAELRDLGPSWRTRNRPDHPQRETAPQSGGRGSGGDGRKS